MSFSSDIAKFAQNAKTAFEQQKEAAAGKAKTLLQQTLGEETKLIQSISLDADVGKFHSVVAPEHIIAKLKDAGLLKP